MSKPLVPIIIPVYNVELYLSKCIDSIFAQPFTEEFKKMKDLYPYTQQKIIQKYPHSFLSLALKGFPRFAYFARSVYRLFSC